MPTKHNKKRYQAKAKPAVLIVTSGRTYLRYRDDEALEQAQKGDFMLFPSVDALHGVRQGEYERRGFTGYFKLDVFDGKAWQPVRLTDIFTGEHYFGKAERPLDTALLCLERLAARGPMTLKRIYREHYTTVDEEES